MMMDLKPSEIRYSQDSICRQFGFGNHRNTPIGETLDQLLINSIRAYNIPRITVSKIGRLWYTGDNRRLWVFRKAAEFGVLKTIPVIDGYISNNKFTTVNEGHSVTVRGDPGGFKWRMRTCRTIPVYEPPSDPSPIPSPTPRSEPVYTSPTDTFRIPSPTPILKDVYTSPTDPSQFLPTTVSSAEPTTPTNNISIHSFRNVGYDNDLERSSDCDSIIDEGLVDRDSIINNISDSASAGRQEDTCIPIPEINGTDNRSYTDEHEIILEIPVGTLGQTDTVMNDNKTDQPKSDVLATDVTPCAVRPRCLKSKWCWLLVNVFPNLESRSNLLLCIILLSVVIVVSLQYLK